MRFLKIENCFSAWSATPFRPFSIQAPFKTVRPHQTICWPCLIDGAACPFTAFAYRVYRAGGAWRTQLLRWSAQGCRRFGAVCSLPAAWAAAAAVAKSSVLSPVFCCLFFSMPAYLLPAGALPCWPADRLGSGAAALRRRRCARAGELALDLAQNACELQAFAQAGKFLQKRLRIAQAAQKHGAALNLVSAGRAGTAAPDRNRLERTGALPGGPLRTT